MIRVKSYLIGQLVYHQCLNETDPSFSLDCGSTCILAFPLMSWCATWFAVTMHGGVRSCRMIGDFPYGLPCLTAVMCQISQVMSSSHFTTTSFGVMSVSMSSVNRVLLLSVSSPVGLLSVPTIISGGVRHPLRGPLDDGIHSSSRHPSPLVGGLSIQPAYSPPPREPCTNT